MIRTVELANFIAHSSTKLEFEDGVTVFVGHNGAGKSSIIDAITFALFGEHTRKSNKSLIRRGTNQAYVKINFSVNGKDYEATRKIDSKGSLVAQLVEKRNGQEIPLAEGERKQFGESVTEQIEAKIGLDFTKLKVASIVQQGELNSIIKAKPKEFKELLNAIIGIDKLDLASEGLKVVQKNFRQSIRQKYGYDDTDIEILKNELQECQSEVKQSEPQKQELQKQKEIKEEELQTLEQKIKADSEKEFILKQLEERKQDFRKYVKDAILTIQKDIMEKEHKIKECNGCFDLAEKKSELELELQNIESEISNIMDNIQEYEKTIVKLQEHQELAKKLQLQDGKCPVCDSHVNELKPVFQIKHIKKEQEKLNKEIKVLSLKKQKYTKEKTETSSKLKKAELAQKTLEFHSIETPEHLKSLRDEVELQKSQIQKIPLTIDVSGRLIEAASIDAHARSLYEKIEGLEQEISGFDPIEFVRLKQGFEQKRREISVLDQKYGAIIEKIKGANEKIAKTTSILVELESVRDYIARLDEIQSNVYNRDGPVATSLRSWALNTISSKASEYLGMLNTKIHRITLSEKTRDITITAFSKNTQIDIDSLSGGEQVGVALALRLGMAHLLGSSNLNFVILDEPTTHLDSERRRALVRVLSQLSDISNDVSGPFQFIIITHDAEIFEDSTVEKIYKFESSENGTKVSLL
jgi:exonuclease SbcC